MTDTNNTDWIAPSDAVNPVNHFHTLYMRLTAISEGLLQETAGLPDFARNPAFGELIGRVAEFANAAGRMTALLEGIRRDFPDVWDLWLRAILYEPPKEDLHS